MKRTVSGFPAESMDKEVVPVLVEAIKSTAVVRVIDEDLVLVDWGPMTLTVSAWRSGRARPVMAAKASRSALSCLRTLSDFQGYLKQRVASLPPRRPLPPVVKRAVDAVRKIDPDLTPLAAVAGAVADEVADRAAEMGADRIIVNNGGDIAVRAASGEAIMVGLRLPDSDKLVGRVGVEGGSGIGGVASSGWSGRSHSPGVADMVTVWAPSAALADAAATFIAGETAPTGENLDILKRGACELDPLSDLGVRNVTIAVGDLTPGQRHQALEKGYAAAEALFTEGLLRGCWLCVQGDTILLDPYGVARIDPMPAPDVGVTMASAI
jgi:ApbE superfamily uncharacterized protein (UPF0280 family)